MVVVLAAVVVAVVLAAATADDVALGQAEVDPSLKNRHLYTISVLSPHTLPYTNTHTQEMSVG